MSVDWRGSLETTIKVVGLLTAMFGVYRYFEDSSKARNLAERQAALSYVATYNGSEIKSSARTLFKFWVRNADAVVYLQTVGMSADDYRSFLLTAFEHDESPAQLLDAVYGTATFYDEVALCRSAKVCDASIIKTNFCSSAHEFASKYQPVFAQLAILSATPAFGAGAKALGQSC